MGSFKGNGRGRGPGRRRVEADRRRAFPRVESLESRRLLTGNPPTWHPTNTNLADVVNGPMGNAGDELIKVYFQYQNYLKGGGQGDFAHSALNTDKKFIYFVGDKVGVQIRARNHVAYVSLLADLPKN